VDGYIHKPGKGNPGKPAGLPAQLQAGQKS